MATALNEVRIYFAPVYKPASTRDEMGGQRATTWMKIDVWPLASAMPPSQAMAVADHISGLPPLRVWRSQ
jgi:hypothetical protein